MQCEEHLALTAILTGLRRTGAIDKRAITSITICLKETADKVRPHRAESADGLLALAASLEEGPAKSCSVAINEWLLSSAAARSQLTAAVPTPGN